MIHVKRWLNFYAVKLMYTSMSVTRRHICLRVQRYRSKLRQIEHTGRSTEARKNEPSVVALTKKISQFSLEGEVANARMIFDKMVRDSVSWNVIIRCYLEKEMVDDARELFDRMPERTSYSWNTMIMGYIKLGKFHMALKLFVVMPDKDVFSWTAMITGLCRASWVDEAWSLFKQMPYANAVSWSSIISGFQQNGFLNESLNMFREMLLAGIQPTCRLFTSILSACAGLAIVSVSEPVYCQLLERGFHNNTHVGNSAISMFVKTRNAMIMGFGQHGFGVEYMMIFHQMQKAQVLPDGISFMGLLHGCSHCGFLQEGRQYFHSMRTDYGISPGLEHYSAMVDLYARAGKLKEAYMVILDLSFEPTAVIWRTLLNGCRIWGDMELGAREAEQILKLEPHNSSACLMVIDIFATAGKWKEVAKMRQTYEGHRG